MKVARKPKKTGQPLPHIGPVVPIDPHYKPHYESVRESPKTGTGLSLGISKQDGSKAPRVTVLKFRDRQVLTLDHPDLTAGSALLMKALGTGD
jgi:hypothetical protein